ncbi:tripartite tricarboxylate transporter substrate-binding protein [Nonomuraea rhizosphaerae]|uniref:tripartite tricarboxylate transporter substrate-binding protein n=1 Tax=Nonomuraea rhizosphaerae TaxID=2665663 RepID=UPI001C5ED6F6|nr:tripartite tricarboxylate transporter substrate-binding protein [Nonomuraea rhizosphaerae]
MRRRRFFAFGLGVAACAAGCGTERSRLSAAGTLARYTIVPGDPRWSRVARVLGGAVRDGESVLVGGPPGVRITVTGLPALATAEVNEGPSLIGSTTPLARLGGKVEAVLVSANSRFRTFEQFGAHLRARPDGTPLAGGPPGEPDHLLFGMIAKGLGADARQLDYTGFAGGSEAASALLGGKAAAATGALADWRDPIARGWVRVLAVSSARRVPGVEAPSLLECGVRVDFADWCAAVGPGGMSDDGRAAAIRLCETVTGSARWRRACRAGGWTSIPLSGDDFTVWLTSEIGRTRAVLRDLGMLTMSDTTCWGSCEHGH